MTPRRPPAHGKRQGGHRVLLASAVMVVVAALGIGVVVLVERPSAPATTNAPSGHREVTRPPTTPTHVVTKVVPAVDPGTLPQTMVEPPSTDAELAVRLAPLFGAMLRNATNTASGYFFPETAYVAMKTGELPDPALDYRDRLLAFYGLDLAVYHQALSGKAVVHMVAVHGPQGAARWIYPGECENRIGYWHLPGVRFVYRQGSVTKSFAIASLISWRGAWYVVHLGPNPRPVNVGTIDQPAIGPGTPGPPGGC